PQRLVMVWEDYRQRGGPEHEWFSPPDFKDLRDQTQSLEHVTTLLGWLPTLTGQAEPEDVNGAAVSHDTFTMLGIEPVLGRTFSADEDRPGAERVAIISHRLWQRRFAGDQNIIGKNLTLSGDSFTVIGVMPRKFSFPILPDTDVWRTAEPVIASLNPCGRGC